MLRDKLFLTGAFGTVVAAICCFTPAAVVALGALGLGAYTGWLDPVLLPVLGLSIVAMSVAMVRRLRG